MLNKDRIRELGSALEALEEQGKILMLEKSKKGIQRVVFGRALLIALCTLVQFMIFVAFFTILKDSLSLYLGSYYVLVVFILMIIINSDMNPAMKVPWILVSLVLPVVGGMLYIYVKLSLSNRVLSSRIDNLIREADASTSSDVYVLDALRRTDPSMEKLAGYLTRFGGNKIYQNTNAVYFDSGEAMYPEMIRQLESAREYIFLEFFIIKEGLMWGHILKVLEEKAAQGVEVRVMYDGFNSLTNLPVNYPRKLRQLGIKCRVFSPIRPLFSSIYNNRDHRKILVVDGRVGFSGGVNLSDEYINQWERFGYWKDAGIMLEGDAVQGLTQLFLQMWNITDRESEFDRFLSPGRQRAPVMPESYADYDGLEEDEEIPGFVQPYGDCPLDDELVGRNVYMYMINRAVDHVHFMTPYLIIDHELSECLCFAAKRGIKVRLILPLVPDKRVAFALAKSHYKNLLKAGVEIYEFTPGFVHAKVAEVDGEIAVVGTINLDYRSFYYHFENGILLYRCPAMKAIQKDFEETFKESKQVSMNDLKKEKLTVRIIGFIMKAIAPLM